MNLNWRFPLTVFTLCVPVWLIACGAQKEQQFGPTSRGSTGGTSLPSNSQGLLAECSRVATNPQGLAGQISTYYHAGAIVSDYLQLNITTYPAAQMTGTAYAQMYRWKEPTAGARQTNSIPVRFYYVNKLTGITANSNPLNLISRASIQNLIDSQKLGTMGVTSTNFFQHYYLVLTGMELQWEAMVVAFYDSSLGTNAIASADILLPAFLADPTKYSAIVPVPSLQVLHPLAHLNGSGASEAEYKRLADEICAEMFGQVRVPASIETKEERSLILRLWAKVKAFLSSLF